MGTLVSATNSAVSQSSIWLQNISNNLDAIINIGRLKKKTLLRYIGQKKSSYEPKRPNDNLTKISRLVFKSRLNRTYVH